MRFDEFDKVESEKTRNLRTFVPAVLFLFLGISMCVLPGLQMIKTEKPASEASRLGSVEYICSHISLPEQFVFVEKTSFTDLSKAEVFYKYNSERSFEEITPYFVVWFSSNDWERAAGESLKFHLKKYTVTIENVDFPDFNYVVNCTETE